MSDTNQHILRTLRAQAWARAKGELEAVLHTFTKGIENSAEPGQYEKLDSQIDQFVKCVEQTGLIE